MTSSRFYKLPVVSRLSCHGIFHANKVLLSPHFVCLKPNLLYTSGGSSYVNLTSQRSFSKVKDSFVTQAAIGEVFDDEIQGEDPLFDLRKFLFKDTDDVHIKELSMANSVTEVFDCIDNIQDIQPEHFTQALATLNHMQKLESLRHYTKHVHKTDCSCISSGEMPRFMSFLSKMEETIEKLSYRDSAFNMMCLRRLRVSLPEHVMIKLYLNVVTNADELDYSTISYLAVSTRMQTEDIPNKPLNNWKFGMLPVVPRLKELLEDCSDIHDLRSIAIAFGNCSTLISSKLMDLFAAKFRSFVEAGEYNSIEGVWALSKLVTLVLGKVDWHDKNPDYTRLLFQQHIGHLDELPIKHLYNLVKAVSWLNYPRDLHDECLRRIEVLKDYQMEDRSDDCNKAFLPTISLLNLTSKWKHYSCCSDAETKATDEVLATILQNDELEMNMKDVFDLLKNRPSCNENIKEEILWKSLELIKDDPFELLHFMRNISFGHYWNEGVIKEGVKFTLNFIPEMVKPRDFANAFSILGKFNVTPTQDIMDRFHTFLPQLNAMDLSTIAHGFRDKSYTSNRFNAFSNNVIDEINVDIQKAAKSILSNPYKKKDMNDLTNLLIVLYWHNKRSSYDELDYMNVSSQILEAADSMDVNEGNKLNILLNKLASRFEFPQVSERIVRFYQENVESDKLFLRDLTILVSSCYNKGHYPGEKILEDFAQATYDKIDCLDVVQIIKNCQKLVAFQSCPEYLAKEIFSRKFMQRTDAIIESLGDNEVAVLQLRKELMKLNRRVVLLMPELGIPWFHQSCKYLIEGSQERPQATKFRQEVYNSLCSALGSWRYVLERSHSEYFNHIHLLVTVNESGVLQDQYTDDDKKAHKKIAIQTYPEQFYFDDTKKLLGSCEANNRELALQGWQVLTISPFNWNSMLMSDDSTRVQYLQESVRAATLN